MYENKMMGLKGQQLSASCNTPNLINPGDDLGYRVEWKQPYLYGSGDSKRTALSATAFNARKLSGVFIAGVHQQPLQIESHRICSLPALCVCVCVFFRVCVCFWLASACAPAALLPWTSCIQL